MAVCMNDYSEQCFGDCKGCDRYFAKCSQCGCGDELYNVDDDVICFACIKTNMCKDYLVDFANEHSELFDEFIREIFEYDLI